MTRNSLLILLSMATSFQLIGCSSVEQTREPAPVGTTDQIQTNRVQPIGSSTVTQTTDKRTAGTKMPPGADYGIDPTLPAALRNPEQRRIYFEYDGFEVKAEYHPVLEAHAKFLASNPERMLRIEGNADERGSDAYNMALGFNRSGAVKGILRHFGAKDAQIEASSNGEMKPAVDGHDEAAWQQNRRADLVYTGEEKLAPGK